jgi:hypothetical protein
MRLLLSFLPSLAAILATEYFPLRLSSMIFRHASALHAFCRPDEGM